MTITKSYVNKITYDIVGAAIEVHKELGPGLLESIYEECLYHELTLKGYTVKRQQLVPVIYKGKEVKNPFRLDVLVNDFVIVELKSKELFYPIGSAQILSHLKLSKRPKGLLINFNVTNITKEGLIPFVTEYFAQFSD